MTLDALYRLGSLDSDSDPREFRALAKEIRRYEKTKGKRDVSACGMNRGFGDKWENPWVEEYQRRNGLKG